MKNDAFDKWLEVTVGLVFVAWASWLSFTVSALQEDVAVLKFKVFGKVAEAISKHEVQQAAAGIIPLPEARKHESIPNGHAPNSRTTADNPVEPGDISRDSKAGKQDRKL